MFAKYVAKASNGWHHSKGFTLQDFAEPIRIKPRNSEILAQRIPRAELEILPRVGHAIPLIDRDVVQRNVLRLRPQTSHARGSL